MLSNMSEPNLLEAAVLTIGDAIGGDVTKESRLAGAGAYTHVDDDAGQYVILTQKLAALEARRRLVVG